MEEPVASRRASTSADGRPRERAPCVGHRNLVLLFLTVGGPASGMFMLAATATMGSLESLSVPQTLHCGQDRRSLQHSSQGGGRTCPNHLRWELEQAVQSVSCLATQQIVRVHFINAALLV